MNRCLAAFVALALALSAANGASLGTNKNINGLANKDGHYDGTLATKLRLISNELAKNTEVIERGSAMELFKIAVYLAGLFRDVPRGCYVKLVITCSKEPIFKDFKACAESYLAEHSDDCSDLTEATELLNVQDLENIKGIENLGVKDLFKITLYLYRLLQRVPTACYIKVVLTCSKNKVFENFKTCAESYVAKHSEQCSNPSGAIELSHVRAVKVNQDIDDAEYEKFEEYLRELYDRVSYNCYSGAVLNCPFTPVFEDYKACVEGYIAKNPDQCSAKLSKATDLKNVADGINVIKNRGFEEELEKMIKYLEELLTNVSPDCLIHMIAICSAEEVFEDFKACADGYIAQNPDQCSAKLISSF